MLTSNNFLFLPITDSYTNFKVIIIKNIYIILVFFFLIVRAQILNQTYLTNYIRIKKDDYKSDRGPQGDEFGPSK